MIEMTETWIDHYERTKRSEVRFRLLASPSESASEQEGRDALYHFCQDALHLRDWIQADQTSMPGVSLEERKARLRILFNESSAALAACADIAIGSKHFACDRKSYTTQEEGPTAKYAEVTRQGVAVAVKTGTFFVDQETMDKLIANLKPTIVSSDSRPTKPNRIPDGSTQYSWFIDAIETEWNALDLAAEALVDWNAWLKAQNML